MHGSLPNVPSSSRPSLDGEAGGRYPGFISPNFFGGRRRRAKKTRANSSPSWRPALVKICRGLTRTRLRRFEGRE